MRVEEIPLRPDEKPRPEDIAARVRLKLPPMTSDEQRAFMDERAPPE